MGSWVILTNVTFSNDIIKGADIWAIYRIPQTAIFQIMYEDSKYKINQYN